jgi:hypothetical protein
MKRRKFLGVIGVSTIAVAFGSYISFSGFEKSVLRVIVEGTKTLKVNREEIVLFIKGANKARLWDSYSISKKELIKWCSLLDEMKIPLPFIARYKWYKQEIINQFLFSTSFFYTGMDESKPVRYLSIYDPYSKPCCNPFSNLYYTD